MISELKSREPFIDFIANSCYVSSMSTIDIIIPVYNEEKFLDAIIQKVEETDFCGLEKHIILVDDCSTDSSREILAKYNNYKIIYHEKNCGKGAAVRTGIKNSSSDIICIQDADLEYNPEDYQKLLPFIINNEAQVVYGSRLSDKKQKKSFLFLSYVANTFLTILTNILYNCKITDMETCYKAFRREILDGINLRAEKYDFEVELTAKIAKKGIKIKEVPISYNGRAWTEGKKVSAKDGIHAILALIYYRFFN